MLTAITATEKCSRLGATRCKMFTDRRMDRRKVLLLFHTLLSGEHGSKVVEHQTELRGPGSDLHWQHFVSLGKAH